jgi:hypothetical protein
VRFKDSHVLSNFEREKKEDPESLSTPFKIVIDENDEIEKRGHAE